MQPLIVMALILGAAPEQSAGPALQQAEVTYGFACGRYEIRMTVGFPQPYVGRRLAFYSSLNPRKELCFAPDGGSPARCVDRFVGAVATVQYSVRLRNSKSPGRAAIRELVTVVAQSEGLPERPPFSKTVPLVNGIGSDIQVFGYDEAEVDEADRLRTRQEVSQSVWRVYRQALYIEDEPLPFVVLQWRHTIDEIRLLHVSPAGGPG